MFHKGQKVKFSKKGWENWETVLPELHPSYTKDKIWAIKEVGISRNYPIVLHDLPYRFGISELELVEPKPLILKDWI